MSEIAARARALAGALLPRTRTAAASPDLAAVNAAIAALRQLHPLDAYDEMAIHEAAETLLRLRDASSLP